MDHWKNWRNKRAYIWPVCKNENSMRTGTKLYGQKINLRMGKHQRKEMQNPGFINNIITLQWVSKGFKNNHLYEYVLWDTRMKTPGKIFKPINSMRSLFIRIPTNVLTSASAIKRSPLSTTPPKTTIRLPLQCIHITRRWYNLWCDWADSRL